MRRGLLLATVLVACSSSPETTAPAKACDAGFVDTDHGCVRVGPSTCAAGFAMRAQTCEPVLPAEACPRGTHAVPGDATCHELGRGDEPSGTILHVDASASGGGDGSAARPFQKVQAALDAAPAGATVLVAPGTYAEDLSLTRAVTLMGVDPAKVELRGVDAAKTTLDVRADATIAGVAITGPAQGLSVRDAHVKASRLWVHDTGKPGIGVDRSKGEGFLALERSLIESCSYAGVAVFGATLELTSTTIRDIELLADKGGPGVLGQAYLGVPATITVRGSLVERTHEAGIGVAGGNVTVEASVVRSVGPMADGKVGNGILASYDKATKTAPTLVVRDTLVADVLQIGISQTNGVGTIERTTVRGTRGAPARPDYGVGIQADPGAVMTIRESVIEDNRHLGVAVFAAKATLERTLVRGTRTDDGKVGGVGVGLNAVGSIEAAGEITECLIEGNQTGGVMFGDGSFRLVSTTIRDTIATSDGRFGDGVIAAGHPRPDGSFLVDAIDLRVERSARVGISAFGGSMRVTGSRLRCNTIDLARGGFSVDASLVDGSGNSCGCDGEVVCKITFPEIEAVPFPAR